MDGLLLKRVAMCVVSFFYICLFFFMAYIFFVQIPRARNDVAQSLYTGSRGVVLAYGIYSCSPASAACPCPQALYALVGLGKIAGVLCGACKAWFVRWDRFILLGSYLWLEAGLGIDTLQALDSVE